MFLTLDVYMRMSFWQEIVVMLQFFFTLTLSNKQVVSFKKKRNLWNAGKSRSWAHVPAALTGRNSEERNTPSPIDPEAIEVDINFQPDPTDLVLSSVPGGELFNPRKHKFSEDELKPQPMIKKAKKVFVPDDQKVACCSIINIINCQTN